MAKLELSALYRAKKEYKKAQELLDKIPEVEMDKKIQQALLYESSGKIDEAYRIYEGELRKNAHETFTALSLMINLAYKEKKLSEAKEYIERAKKVADVFDLGAFHKYQLDLSLARGKQDKEKAIEMIINMVNETSSMAISLKSKLYKHMKFNVNSSWDKDKYERVVKGAFKIDKTLDFVKDDSMIKFLLE